MAATSNSIKTYWRWALTTSQEKYYFIVDQKPNAVT
jgi:hypothetical protein